MSFRDIPFGSAEAFNAVVEVSDGDFNKYEYDEELDVLRLDFVFRDGFHFPFNYGYIPETRGGDGDHLDVILLNSYPLEKGTIALSRAIGIIELMDRGEEDNKIIAVPIGNTECEKLQTIEDLPKGKLEEFRQFFKGLEIQKSKTLEIKGFHGKEQAVKELQRARSNYNSQKRGE